jgi:hypothetical protein
MALRALALSLILAATGTAAGQGNSPHVEVALSEPVAAGTGFAITSIQGILTEGSRQETLRSGFSTAIHASLELYRKGGWLGTFGRESLFEWDVIVEYSPATKVYHLRRVVDNRAVDLGEAATIQEAEEILRKPYSPPLSPDRSGSTYFYRFVAEVSTLSLSDLEAWQRWVRGEAQPAVRGKRNPGTALQRGLGALLSRVLGGDTQSYERRSATFTAG